MRYISNGHRWVVCSKCIQGIALYFAMLSTLIFVFPVQAQLAAPDVWQSELEQDHELVGKIWSESDQSFIGIDELVSRISGARYLLIGEKHDNPDHHAIQLNVLEFLSSEGKLSQLAMEMMDATATPLLSTLYEQPTLSDAELKE